MIKFFAVFLVQMCRQLVVLQENDKQRQRGSGIHECSNSSETISNGNGFPLFRIAGENLEFLDDTNILPFFHHLKEGVDVQGFYDAIAEEWQEEKRLHVFILIICIRIIIKLNTECIKDCKANL